MNAALAIAAKDLRQRVRDRSAIIISIAAPFALAYLFSVMIPSGANAFDPRYLLVDLDRGTIATAVRQGPLEGLRQAGATIDEVATVDAARAEVAAGEAAAAIVLPAGLSASVGAGQAAELQLIGSVNATLATQIARSALIAFADSVEAVQLSVATVLAAGPGAAAGASPGTAALAQAALAQAPPIAVVAAAARDRVGTDVTYYASSMAVLFVFFAAQFGVVSLLAERRAGTLARMLATPIGPRAILVGKLLVSIVLGCISMSVIALGTTLLLGARWGDPIAVGALIVSTSLAASGIALLVVGFAHNEDQAGSLTAIVAMVLAVFGGSFFRINQAPEALAAIGQLTPHAWFLRGIGDLASGEGIAIVLPSLAVLLAIGVVTAALGLFRAGRVVVPR